KPECWVLLCGVVGWKEDAVEQESGNWLDGTLQAYRHRFSFRTATHVGCSQRVIKFFVYRAIGCLSWADGQGLAAAAVNGPERNKRSCVRVAWRPVQRGVPLLKNLVADTAVTHLRR